MNHIALLILYVSTNARQRRKSIILITHSVCQGVCDICRDCPLTLHCITHSICIYQRQTEEEKPKQIHIECGMQYRYTVMQYTHTHTHLHARQRTKSPKTTLNPKPSTLNLQHQHEKEEKQPITNSVRQGVRDLITDY